MLPWILQNRCNSITCAHCGPAHHTMCVLLDLLESCSSSVVPCGLQPLVPPGLPANTQTHKQTQQGLHVSQTAANMTSPSKLFNISYYKVFLIFVHIRHWYELHASHTHVHSFIHSFIHSFKFPVLVTN